MPTSTITSLVNAFRESQILSEQQLRVVTSQLQPQFSDPKALARELIQRGWVTPLSRDFSDPRRNKPPESAACRGRRGADHDGQAP